MKRSRYQHGALFTEARKNGPAVWVYRWRETNSEGKRSSRREILGTVHEIRNQAESQQAAEKLRLGINRNLGQGSGAPATIRKLVEHYQLKEIPMESHEGKRRSTKLGYLSNLNCHIVPKWGDYHPIKVKTGEVEAWLKSLPLAPASRAKVRNGWTRILSRWCVAVRSGCGRRTFVRLRSSVICLRRCRTGSG